MGNMPPVRRANERGEISTDSQTHAYGQVLEGARNGRLPPYPEDDIHLVVPTDCTQMGTWHTELLAYSALRVKQPGKITRVATGCEKGKTDFAQIHRSVHDQ